jgi:Ankyrin repeats (3 copies)
MPTKTLPLRRDLDSLKDEARRLLRDAAAAEPQACQRMREFHPRLATLADPEIAVAPLTWSDALLSIAREYGFASWPRLKAHVEGPPRPGAPLPHHERVQDPVFRHAIDLMDDGDAATLTALLRAHPGLATRHVAFEGENYFRNPSLLSFVAENPIRHDSLPPNIVEIATVILAAGAGADRRAVNETLALVASGRVPREAGVQRELIALLCAHGGNADGAILPALTHGEFAAADALLRHGARPSLVVAAGLGREAEADVLLRDASDAERHLALTLAAQHGRAGIARMLLDAGTDPSRYNPVGAHAHSTPLHQAVWYGHEDLVRLLVERGARRDLEDTLHQGTPLDWAEYGGHASIAAFLRQQGPNQSRAPAPA